MREWIPTKMERDGSYKLPAEHKLVLLAFPENSFGSGSAPATAVGYLRYAAGDKNSPMFVTPGIGGFPTHWRDCLPDDFGAATSHPYWKFPKP